MGGNQGNQQPGDFSSQPYKPPGGGMPSWGGGAPSWGGGGTPAPWSRPWETASRGSNPGMLGTDWLASNQGSSGNPNPGRSYMQPYKPRNQLPAGFSRPGSTGSNPGMLGTQWLARNNNQLPYQSPHQSPYQSPYQSRGFPTLNQGQQPVPGLQAWMAQLKPRSAEMTDRRADWITDWNAAQGQPRSRYSHEVGPPLVPGQSRSLYSQEVGPSAGDRLQLANNPDLLSQGIGSMYQEQPQQPTPPPLGSRMPAGFTQPGAAGSNPGMLGTDFLASIGQPGPPAPAQAQAGVGMPAGFTQPGATGSNPGMLGTDFLKSIAPAAPGSRMPAGFSRPGATGTNPGMLGTDWLAQNAKKPGLPAGFTRPGTTGTNPGMLGTDWLAQNT